MKQKNLGLSRGDGTERELASRVEAHGFATRRERGCGCIATKSRKIRAWVVSKRSGCVRLRLSRRGVQVATVVGKSTCAGQTDLGYLRAKHRRVIGGKTRIAILPTE